MINYYHQDCAVSIFIENTTFESVDEDFVKYVLENNITNVTLVSSKNIQDYLSSQVRFITHDVEQVDFDIVYLECIRDVRR